MLLLLRKRVAPADLRVLRDEARALSLEARGLDRASRVVAPAPGRGAAPSRPAHQLASRPPTEANP